MVGAILPSKYLGCSRSSPGTWAAVKKREKGSFKKTSI